MKEDLRKKLISCAAAVLACALIIIAVCGHVFAKYASSESFNGNQVSIDDFYFTADILGDSVDESTSEKTINIYGGGSQTLAFSVRNYFDSLRVTSSAVTYTISVSSTSTSAEVKDSNQTTTICSVTTGGTATSSGITISSGSGSQSTEYKLVISAFSAADTVTVTITSSSPFVKTLTLKFVLNVASSGVYCELRNNSTTSSYIELVLSTDVALSSDVVTISWSGLSELQFDNTNSYFALADSSTTSAVSKKAIAADASISVKFFKSSSSSKIYSVSTPNVVSNGGSIESVTITISEATSG